MQAVAAPSERKGRAVVGLAARAADGTNRRAASGAVAARHVEVGGIVLAYDDEGSGPPIVCLHAIGHGARDFERLRARLRGRHRVLALDWPGQGRSASDATPPSATRYAQLLDGFLAATRVERPVLIGNSIGGATALRYAHAHPRNVRALVLENPGGLAPTNDRLAQLVLAAMAGFFAAGRRGARWFPAAFGVYYRSVLQRGAAREHRRQIVDAAYELAPLLEEAWRGFARPDEDLQALAPGIACPVLFAWATRDQLVSLSRSRATIRRFPQARIERFPAGHAPHLETPEAFEASVERFLATLA